MDDVRSHGLGSDGYNWNKCMDALYKQIRGLVPVECCVEHDCKLVLVKAYDNQKKVFGATFDYRSRQKGKRCLVVVYRSYLT